MSYNNNTIVVSHFAIWQPSATIAIMENNGLNVLICHSCAKLYRSFRLQVKDSYFVIYCQLLVNRARTPTDRYTMSPRLIASVAISAWARRACRNERRSFKWPKIALLLHELCRNCFFWLSFICHFIHATSPATVSLLLLLDRLAVAFVKT